MKGSQVEEYLRILDGMVMDEDKIVTYKLLARTLGINVNIAKQLLYVYLVTHKEMRPSTVSAIHLLAGLSKDGTFLVSVMSDDKLDECYEKYKNITSEHIYSIQKGKASGLDKNNQMLFAADTSLPPPKSYPIKYHKVMEVKKQDDSKKNVSENIQGKNDNKTEETSQNQKVRKDEKQKTSKPHSIANMFSNQFQRKKVDKVEKLQQESKNEEKVEVSKNVEPEIEKLPTDEYSENIKINEKPSNSGTFEERMEKKKEVKQDRKKRKRIIQTSEDSESDEEQRDALLCAEPEISDTTQKLKITDEDNDDDKGEIFVENKRRRKKVVDKTVLLDDGFMETHKEVVYESDSDGESPKQKKKEAKLSHQLERKVETKEESESKKMKISGPTNNAKKQSTLFSFFKKV